MRTSVKVYLLMTLQWCLIGTFLIVTLLTEPINIFSGDRVVGMILLVSGLAIFVMSVRAHAVVRGTTRIKPSPIPHEQGGLITSGIYRQVRHPIYSAAIIIFVGIALLLRRPYALALCIPVIILLYVKTILEEGLLTQKFPEYSDFRNRAGRFFPKLRRN